MTLKEMKGLVLKLIEEINPENEYLTDDPDISAKINEVINLIQNELARIKKIPAKDEMEVVTSEEIEFSDIDRNLYQLNIVRGVKNEIINDTILINSDGVAQIYYYKYPRQITSDTDEDTYRFELSNDALAIMPYGVAGDLLKSDISAQYGQIYSNRYEQMLQRLDPRYHTGSLYIDGGDIDEFL